MDDVGSDRDVHGDRNSELRSGREDARTAVGKLTLASIDVVADGFPEPFPIMGSTDDRLVEHATGFLCHPEASLVDFRVDLFRRVPMSANSKS